MGIDAEMFVRVKRQVPDDEVRRLRLMLGSAFGASAFWIFKKEGVTGEAPIDQVDYEDPRYHKSHRHLIERIPTYTQDGDDIVPDPGETFLRVYPCQRYYGIGYERGDLPFLLSLARFLRDATGGEVWYGGDSSGVCAMVLDSEHERELWAHFVKSQHEPYYTDFGGEGMPRPHCAMCGGAPMRFSGAGRHGMWTTASCRGCGASVETTDGGVTWAVRKEEAV